VTALPADVVDAPDAAIDAAKGGPDGDPPVDTPAPARNENAAIESLRQILVGRENARIDGVEARLGSVEDQVGDEEALARAITPLMHTAIRRQIQDARAEMIEALYPIIGALIGRAVTEAMRDLARQVDGRMRQGVDPRLWWWRVRARLGGVPDDELSLRAVLPFQVNEVFLIHHETGLLLLHASRQATSTADSEIISGMLTAIRDFASEAFGYGETGELDEIQYGRHRILIETGRLSYLAVAADGVEPPGFRAELRNHIHAIERDHGALLRDYTGDAAPLAPLQSTLAPVLESGQARPLSRTQKWLLAGAGAGIIVAITGVFGTGFLFWRVLRAEPAARPAVVPVIHVIVTATAAPSVPTPDPTVQLPTVQRGVMLGNAWAREGPSDDAPPMRVVRIGQEVQVLDAADDRLLVRWISGVGGELTGWVVAEQVQLDGSTAPTTPAAATATPTSPR
jgi:hypothetical protein